MLDCQRVVHRAGVLAASAWLFAAGSGVGAGAVAAEPIKVQFDCYPVIVCRDVTPDEFSDLRRSDLRLGEKVIEARIRVTARIVAGVAEDLREILIEVQNPERRSPIEDFEPKTQVESDLVEPIQITSTQETSRSVGIGVGSSIAVPSAGPKSEINPSASIGAARRSAITSTLKKRPPMQPIVISGTTHQGYGWFVKLRPSSQNTLEGVHELKCRLRVPADWRGDWLLLSCRAEGRWTKYFVKSDGVCGENRYVLGLHAEGDAQALRLAERLARAQLLPVELNCCGDDVSPRDDSPRSRSERLREISQALSEMSGSGL